jgi:hypothetical protein
LVLGVATLVVFMTGQPDDREVETHILPALQIGQHQAAFASMLPNVQDAHHKNYVNMDALCPMTEYCNIQAHIP